MANNSALINYITSVIRSNGNQEITGDILQEVLLDIVNRLGYQFAGIAKPTTEPPLYPDANIWYLASAAGTYTNFNGVVLDGNTLVAFVWNGEWTSHPLIDCNIEIDSGVSEEWVNNKLLEVLAPLIVKIDNAYNLFDIDDNGNIYVKKDADGNPRTLWSYGDIVAGGNSEGEDPSTLTTIGELVNVADNADDIYSIDKVLIKLANSTEWTLADLSSLVGLDEQALASYLTTNNYAKKSDIEEAIKQTDVAKLTTRVTTIEQTLADWFEFDAENGKLYLKKDANGNVRHFVSYGDVIAGGDSEGGTSSLTVGYEEVITEATGTLIGNLLVNGNPIPIYAPLGGGTASNVEWTNVLNKPTTLPNPKALTVGSKSYDGSTAITITASDLGAITSLDGYVNEIATTGSGNAITSVSKSGKVITFTKGTTFLTSHQTLYALTIKNSVGTTQLTYTPNSAAGTITLTKAMVGLGSVENTALSTWGGSSYITKVGTITSGVWQGSAIANAYVANLPISKITNLQTTLDSKLDKATFDDIFELDSTNGKLYLKKDSSGNVRHFVAYGDIIAGGDSEGGETPTTSIDWSALAAATTEQINISHLTDALSNYVTTSTLSSTLSGYLPLSGGTISGNIVWGNGKWGVDASSMGVFMSWRDTNYLHITSDGAFYNWNTLIHSGNYASYALPLSGGTINSTILVPLSINTTWSDQVRIEFAINSSNKALVGWHKDYGAWLYNCKGSYIGVKDDGTPHYNNNTLIHSGNYSSYALPLSGGTIDNQSTTNGAPLKINTNYSTETGLQVANNGIVKSVFGWHQSYGAYLYNATMYYYLGIKDDGTPHFSNLSGGFSHTLIHSGNIGSYNAGSATKLQTARTIWGQSFNGTGDVWGSITVKADAGFYHLNSKGDWLAYIGGDSSFGGVHLYNFLYGNSIRLYNDGRVAIPEGNVLIGTTSDNGAKLQVNGGAKIYINIQDNHSDVTNFDSTKTFSLLYTEDNRFGLNIWLNDNGSASLQPSYFNQYPSTFNLNLCPLSGNVLIGTTTDSGAKLYVAGNITATGEITAGSDIRYKSIQNDVILDTKAIANAPIFNFRWTDREDDKLHLGTSAQYWLDYAPNAVTNGNDFYSLNYGVLGVAIGVSNAKKLLSHEERIVQLEKENKQLKEKLERYGIE